MQLSTKLLEAKDGALQVVNLSNGVKYVFVSYKDIIIAKGVIKNDELIEIILSLRVSIGISEIEIMGEAFKDFGEFKKIEEWKYRFISHNGSPIPMPSMYFIDCLSIRE